MITTRFLHHDEYSRFGDWLKAQSRETLALYFGAPVGDAYIDSLVERVSQNSGHHQFLVAEELGQTVGVLHIAVIDSRSVEFAISVSEQHRRQGIGDRLVREALVWSRNRLFLNIYLHCLTRNVAVRRLCERHNLRVHGDGGDSEVAVHLLPPSFYTIFRETEKNISDLMVMAVLGAGKRH